MTAVVFSCCQPCQDGFTKAMDLRPLAQPDQIVVISVGPPKGWTP